MGNCFAYKNDPYIDLLQFEMAIFFANSVFQFKCCTEEAKLLFVYLNRIILVLSCVPDVRNSMKHFARDPTSVHAMEKTCVVVILPDSTNPNGTENAAKIIEYHFPTMDLKKKNIFHLYFSRSGPLCY